MSVETTPPLEMTVMIETTIDGEIATVTLRTRTMPPAFFSEIRGVFESLKTQREVRAIVLRSEEKGFSYGLDLPAAFSEHADKFIAGGGAVERRALRELIGRWQAAFSSVAESPAPVIAALHGWCIGGGLDLAAACDQLHISEPGGEVPEEEVEEGEKEA